MDKANKRMEQFAEELAEMRGRVVELETVGEMLRVGSEHGDDIADFDVEGLELTDLVETDRLQELQDKFSEAAGIAVLLFDADGKPITEPSNFTEFCTLIRATEKGAAACERSDASDAELTRKHAERQRPPVIHPCGNFPQITDGAVPIVINGKHMATWGMGQVLTGEIDDDEIRAFARHIETDAEKLVAASKKLFKMPKERVKKIAHFLDILAKHVSQLGLQNLQRARLLDDLRRTEKERAQLQQRVIEAQQEALRQLSTPIIPLMAAHDGSGGIIIMPLIGVIDTARARDIMRALLAGITEYRAKVVILDITGVPIVDSGVANHLNKTIQAARLKGAHTIVTGISDAVAETIVDLGIDWAGIETLSDLRVGLVTGLSVLGYRLARLEQTNRRRRLGEEMSG